VRYPPALIALAVIVVAVIGGSTFIHRSIDEAGARAQAAPGIEQTEVAVEPEEEAPRLTLPDPLPVRTVDVPILMYHRIAMLHGGEPAMTVALTVDPQEFGLQMQWLKANGYQSISQQQLYDALMEGAPLPEKPVLITFDDGYRGIATLAAPIMQRVGFFGTAYVITDRIAKNRKTAPTWMTWGHLRLLEKQGWDIGSHTVSHRELPRLSPEAAAKQLRQSRVALEKNLGHPVQWFCYPAGRVNDAAVEAVRAAGYVLAVTTASGRTQNAEDPLRLSRIRIDNSTGVRGLSAALS